MDRTHETQERRREHVIDAALQLAADRGIENVTLRSAARAAQVSWDSVQLTFTDQIDLLRALSQAVTERNIAADEITIDVAGSLHDKLGALVTNLWETLTRYRDYQLISYELAVLALRRTALRPLVVAQYETQRTLAEQLLEAFADRHAITWSRSAADIATFAATFLDGLSISWLVDADTTAADRQIAILAEVLATFVVQEES